MTIFKTWAKLAGVLVLAFAPITALAEENTAAKELLPEPQLADNGLHIQPFFLQSFLDLSEDIADAQAEGKGLLIIVEQQGCPYCRELHRVNFRIPDIVDEMTANFNVLQLDLRGARELTDANGNVGPERDIIKKWGVVYTPTLLYIPRDAQFEGKTAAKAAVAVMPGYFKPFHFATMIEYVASDAYRDQHFQDFVNARADRLRAQGKQVVVWE